MVKNDIIPIENYRFSDTLSLDVYYFRDWWIWGNYKSIQVKGVVTKNNGNILLGNRQEIDTKKSSKRNRVFMDLAETGKSSMGRFFGFKLHPVCNDKGELLNFCLTKGNVDDRNTDVFRVPGRNLSGKPTGIRVIYHPPCLISFSVTVFTG